MRLSPQSQYDRIATRGYMKNRVLFLAVVFAMLLGLIATYANHFNNDFHFDDGHTIVANSYIKSLSNTWLFFFDGRTGSVLPANQTYRPLFSLSVAIDHAIAGGLKPFYFHLSRVLLFLCSVLCVYLLPIVSYDSVED
jgi:hypothetical protein